jgi:hypothetical protein
MTAIGLYRTLMLTPWMSASGREQNLGRRALNDRDQPLVDARTCPNAYSVRRVRAHLSNDG